MWLFGRQKGLCAGIRAGYTARRFIGLGLSILGDNSLQLNRRKAGFHTFRRDAMSVTLVNREDKTEEG